MKNRTQSVMMAVAAAALASSAQAAGYTGDLLVGFSEPGIANTYVFDLGSAAALYNGEQWNLGSGLQGAGFPATLGSGNVSFGVIGYSGSTVFATFNSSAIASLPDTSMNDLLTVKLGINTLGLNQGAQPVDIGGIGADWSSETIVGGLSTSLVNNLWNPNATGTSGQAYLFARDFSSGFGDGSSTAQSSFSLAGNGTLTYGAVPEPSSFALLSGMGLLALWFRRRFVHKG